MLRALIEAGIWPDLDPRHLVGALNGAMLAATRAPAVVERLTELWETAAQTREIYADGAIKQVLAGRAHRHPPALQRAAAPAPARRAG